MIFLFESELPENKSVNFALKHVYGLGKYQANILCKKLGFSKNFKINELSKEQLETIVFLITNTPDLTITVNLKKLKLSKRKNLISMKSYRGLRLKQGLPVRGQRTHTNARTSRKKK